MTKPVDLTAGVYVSIAVFLLHQYWVVPTPPHLIILVRIFFPKASFCFVLFVLFKISMLWRFNLHIFYYLKILKFTANLFKKSSFKIVKLWVSTVFVKVSYASTLLPTYGVVCGGASACISTVSPLFKVCVRCRAVSYLFFVFFVISRQE